jgi:hypothetical protein
MPNSGSRPDAAAPAAGKRARDFFSTKIPCNPLKRLDSDERIQGNPSFSNPHKRGFSRSKGHVPRKPKRIAQASRTGRVGRGPRSLLQHRTRKRLADAGDVEPRRSGAALLAGTALGAGRRIRPEGRFGQCGSCRGKGSVPSTSPPHQVMSRAPRWSRA